jgi:hypothetical protein
MPIKVTCPECETVLKAPSKLGGKRARCPGCDNVLDIPKKRGKKKKKDSDSEDTDVFGALSSAADSAPTTPRTGSSAVRGLPKTKKKKKGTLIAVILVLLIMGGIGGGVAYYVMNKTTVEEGSGYAKDSVEAKVQEILDSVTKDSSAAAWAAMPPSYRNDFNRLARGFGEKLGEDSVLYEQAFRVMGDLGAALEKKKGLFQQSKIIGEGGFTQKGLVDNWSDLAAVFTALSASNIATASKLKEFDGKAFFSSPDIAKAFKHLMNASKMRAHVITWADLAKADLKRTDTPPNEQEAKQAAQLTFSLSGRPKLVVDLATVGGHWLPLDFIGWWVDQSKWAHEQTKLIPEAGGLPPEIKTILQEWVADAATFSNAIDKAKTLNDIDDALLASPKIGAIFVALKKAQDAKKAADEAKRAAEDAKKAEAKAKAEAAATKDKDKPAEPKPTEPKPVPGVDTPKDNAASDLPELK